MDRNIEMQIYRIIEQLKCTVLDTPAIAIAGAHAKGPADKSSDIDLCLFTDAPKSYAERLQIMAAIGNHDEKTGTAVDAVSAALILADKCDVRRSRVRAQKQIEFDIHDRVNYAVTSAELSVDAEKRVIALDIEIDDAICPVMDYFEIFMERMLMCRRAAEMLGCRFSLRANGGKVL